MAVAQPQVVIAAQCARVVLELDQVQPALAVVWSYLLLGEVIKIPSWLIDLSPFERVPALPAGHLALMPLVVITARAFGFTAVGLAAFRRCAIPATTRPPSPTRCAASASRK